MKSFKELVTESSLGDHKGLRKYSDNLSAHYKDDKTAFEIAADHIKSGDKKSLAAHLQHSDTDVRDKILKHVKKDHWSDLGYKSTNEAVEYCDACDRPMKDCVCDEKMDEAKDTVTKDKQGNVTSWSHEGDWKKSEKKDPVGKIHNMSDAARRKTEKLQKEETMSTFDPMAGYMSQIAKDVGVELVEKTLTPAELKKREEVAKAIERENPGMDKSKKMAIATATAKKVAEDTTDMHYCAKHVFSDRFGEGLVVEGSHAEPDANGLIEWYDVDFGGTVRRVMTEKVKVMHAEYHMNHKKKMSEEDKEGDTPDNEKEKSLAKLAKPFDKVTHADVLAGRGVKKEEVELEDVILESDEVIVEGSITLGDQEHNTRRVPIKHYDEFKKTYPGSRVKFRGPKQGKDNTSKADATHFYIVDKKDKTMSEAMISYSDFKDKIAMHKKAGNKVTDDKYSNNKATYTTIDKDNMGRKVTHTPTGTKMETLGKMGKQDDDESDETEVKQTEKRGRGRPTGSKSGARRHN